VFSRGIHEANDLVAAVEPSFIVVFALGRGIHEANDLVAGPAGEDDPNKITRRGIHEANDLVADAQWAFYYDGAMSRHPRSQ